jgi:hypothetical protein
VRFFRLFPFFLLAPELSPEGEIVPDEKQPEGSQKEAYDEEGFLRLHICAQVNQQDPYPQGGMDGYHKE